MRSMTKKLPAKMTSEQYVARLNAAKAKLARDYCDLFKFWRDCAFKPCRKARRCAGDHHACLQRRAKDVPREVQWQARLQILASTPANAGPPERMAREFLAESLCV
jgi:hypothetical protein